MKNLYPSPARLQTARTIRRPKLDIRARTFRLSFPERTCIMGILNVTPDSFSDGGRCCDVPAALRRAAEMMREGADIIDIGGESTRQGARPVTVDEEIARTAPVIRRIVRMHGVPVSIDTRKAAVAEEAIKAGACIINDVSALAYDPAMAGVAARYKTALILMHMRGTPQTMQKHPRYRDVIAEITASLRRAIHRARASGVAEERIIIDPGIGFGKTAAHNLTILNRLREFHALGRPICIGVSRKSFIGKALRIVRPDERLFGSVAANVAAIMHGAGIIRVHDVGAALQAAHIADCILNEKILCQN